MYITVRSIKKTLGKYVEMTDLYIGVPCIVIFLMLFSIPFTRVIAIIFITVVLFLMIPINLSKKNRMYKVIGLTFKYLIKTKEFIYIKEKGDNCIGKE